MNCPLCFDELIVETTGSIYLAGGDLQDTQEETFICVTCMTVLNEKELNAMKKKVSEAEFVRFAKKLEVQTHKFADRLKCQVCQNLIWKSTKMPDYEATYMGMKTLVEVKQSHATGRWSFANKEQGVRDTQVEEMDNWESTHQVGCWMFIVLGNGRAPKGRGAFLIPWKDWKRIEVELIAEGQKSITFDSGRMKMAKDFLAEWQLVWSDGRWTLPDGHVFDKFLAQASLAANVRKHWDKLPVETISAAPISHDRLPVAA
jgi:hypothetical protein